MVVMSGDSFTPLVYHRRYEIMKFSELETQHWAIAQAEYEGWGRNIVCYCSECGDPIYDRQEVYIFEDGEVVHLDCLSDWACRYKSTARMEDPSAI